jgi:hypothetical protein
MHAVRRIGLTAALAAAWLACERAPHDPDLPSGIERVVVSTVTATEATIRWWTERAERGEAFAWTQDGVVSSATESWPAQSHAVTLRGLRPGSTYHFHVLGPSGRSYLSHFETIEPPAGTSAAWSPT